MTMANIPDEPPPAYSPYPIATGDYWRFTLFSALAPELRMRVWQASLESRIMRRLLVDSQEGSNYCFVTHSDFNAPTKASPTLFWVCREARTAAFLYGKYQTLTPNQPGTYFSPVLDYLWLDPCWSHLLHPRKTEDREPQLTTLVCVRKLMVHPNWSPNGQTHLTFSFGKLPSLTEILVAADEKSVGLHSEIMLKTVADIKKHYTSFGKHTPTEIPRIAIGCLRWIGSGQERFERLVAVFEKSEEMKAHLALVRQEEWKFTSRNFSRPKIAHKLRFVREGGIGEASLGVLSDRHDC